MTSQLEREAIFASCHVLLHKQEHDRALALLEPLNDILVIWLKAHIYLYLADQINEDFKTKSGGDDIQKQMLYETLQKAYVYLMQINGLLPEASNQIREFLSPTLEKAITKCRNGVILTKVIKEEIDDSGSLEEDFGPAEGNYESTEDSFQMNEEQPINLVIGEEFMRCMHELRDMEPITAELEDAESTRQDFGSTVGNYEPSEEDFQMNEAQYINLADNNDRPINLVVREEQPINRFVEHEEPINRVWEYQQPINVVFGYLEPVSLVDCVHTRYPHYVNPITFA